MKSAVLKRASFRLRWIIFEGAEAVLLWSLAIVSSLPCLHFVAALFVMQVHERVLHSRNETTPPPPARDRALRRLVSVHPEGDPVQHAATRRRPV